MNRPHDDWPATKFLMGVIAICCILGILLALAAVRSPNPNPKGLPHITQPTK